MSSNGPHSSDADGQRTPAPASPAPPASGLSGVGSPASLRAAATPSAHRRLPRSDLGHSHLFASPARGARTPGSRTGQSPGASSRIAPPDTPLSMSGAMEEEGGETGDEVKHYIWGTQLRAKDVMDQMRRFVREFREGDDAEQPLYAARLEEVALTEATEFNLDCQHLLAFPPTTDVYHQLVRFPQEVVILLDTVVDEELRRERARLREEGRLDPAPEGGADVDPQVQVRPFHLREQHELRQLGPDVIDQLVSVRGMVIRVTGVIPDLRVGFFRCTACGYGTDVPVERGALNEPTTCPTCSARFSFELQHNRSLFADKQVVKVQETPDAVPDGETPHTVSLYAFDSLVDVAKPGDRVEVTGVYRAVAMRDNPRMRRLKAVYRTYVDALHVRKATASSLRAEDPRAKEGDEYHTSFDESVALAREAERRERRVREMGNDPMIYTKLVQSVAPSIWEMDDIKKGILCLLAGGTHKETSVGTGKFRGEINVLMCGDPGTSKSQLLGYVNKLAPRGIYTSGKGSSAVGLTAYVTKDPDTRELVLESGALVLSDRGVCCIDEFDKMSDSTRSVLHEAMEQQTISVAKAGIICTLNARTSILASANPVESRYNPNLSVVQNLQLQPSLLSRFDLIYLILDKPNAATDKRLARHLVSLYYRDADAQGTAPPYTMKEVAEYLSHVRQHLAPRIGDSAVESLVKGYVDMRRLGQHSGAGRKVVTATPRQLESLIRLAEAHAKLRFADEVVERDVREALRLMDVATQRAAVDPRTGTIDMDLISTGRGATSQAVMEQMAEALRHTLARMRRKAKLTMTQAAAELSRAGGERVDEADVRDVAQLLVDEGAARWHNDMERTALQQL